MSSGAGGPALSGGGFLARLYIADAFLGSIVANWSSSCFCAAASSSLAYCRQCPWPAAVHCWRSIDGLRHRLRPRVEQCVAYLGMQRRCCLPCTSRGGSRRALVAALVAAERADRQRYRCVCASVRASVAPKSAIKLLQLAACKTLASMVSHRPYRASGTRARRAPLIPCGSARKMQHLWRTLSQIPSCARRRKRIARRHTFDIRACPSVAAKGCLFGCSCGGS